MPFPEHKINNWVRHDTVEGVCVRCQRLLPVDARRSDGSVYEKQGAFFLGVPRKFEDCQ